MLSKKYIIIMSDNITFRINCSRVTFHIICKESLRITNRNIVSNTFQGIREMSKESDSKVKYNI